jgi:glycosyltransferase 2 family protein
MNRRNLLITLASAAVLAALFYLQFRQWQDFNWDTFFEHTRQANRRHLITAIGLIFFDYFLRALRWEVMMRPTRRVRVTRLIAPTIIGFTGVALLGRLGELVRPYLIAKKEDVPLSSQLAVWTVERIFDTATFALMLATAIFLFFPAYKTSGLLLLLLCVVAIVVAVLIRHRGEAVAQWTEGKLSRFSSRVAQRVAKQVRAYSEGLNTIQGVNSFLIISLLSVLVWGFVVLAYREVTLAYPEPVSTLTLAQVVLLLGFGMFGSVFQLPVVGGGTQLATIAVLAHIFKIPHELAVSCGIMLWIVTFMAVIPMGLVVAHFEHVSLRRLSQESRGSGSSSAE